MKVLFDYQIFALQKYGGISRYFFELMNQFYHKKNVEFELSLYFSNNVHIETARFSSHRTLFPKINFGLKNKYTKYLNKKNIITSSNAISAQNYDVMHPTYYHPYFLDHLGKKPYVLTIHDMIYEIYPNLFVNDQNTSESKKKLSQKASRIITVSENTKKDLIKFYNIDDEKISVVPLGNSIFIDEKFNTSNYKIKVPKKYLLYVGSRKSYKNFDALLKSVNLVSKEFDDLYIICAGGGNFSKKEKSQIKELGLQERVIYYSIDDKILQYLYSNASAFIFPSLYEGFGIPILEAFECKCPVLLSNASSFPEVAGSAALYFDPKSIVSIKNCISRILIDSSLREKLINEGLKKVKEYSWEKTALETKLIYESII